MIINLILLTLVSAVIGAAVHLIMGPGNHGVGLPHYAFIGGTGWGIGALLEWATGYRTSTFWGTIGLWIICACVAEFAVRRLKQRLMRKESFIETE